MFDEAAWHRYLLVLPQELSLKSESLISRHELAPSYLAHVLDMRNDTIAIHLIQLLFKLCKSYAFAHQEVALSFV